MPTSYQLAKVEFAHLAHFSLRHMQLPARSEIASGQKPNLVTLCGQQKQGDRKRNNNKTWPEKRFSMVLDTAVRQMNLQTFPLRVRHGHGNWLGLGQRFALI